MPVGPKIAAAFGVRVVVAASRQFVENRYSGLEKTYNRPSGEDSGEENRQTALTGEGKPYNRA